MRAACMICCLLSKVNRNEWWDNSVLLGDIDQQKCGSQKLSTHYYPTTGDWQPPYVSVKVEKHEKLCSGRIVSEQEFRALLASLDDVPVVKRANDWKRQYKMKKETWREAQDVLILLRYTGARLNEACQMLMSHVQW